MPGGIGSMSDLSGRLARLSDGQRELFLRRLQQQAAVADEAAAPVATPREREWPLSSEQERLWIADRLDPGNPAYNLALAIRLRGHLEPAAIHRALAFLRNRHDALRVAFKATRSGVVQMDAVSGPVPFDVIDRRGVADTPSIGEVRTLASREIRRRFDLTKGPLWRATLFLIGEEDGVLVVTAHHAIADGWSLGIMYRDLSAAYMAFAEQRTPVLPELRPTYGQVLSAQRERLAAAGLGPALAFWTAHLSGAPEETALPLDRLRPETQTFNGARRRLELDEPGAAKVHDLATAVGATPFMVLLGAFYALLYRFTGQADLTVGIPVADRDVPGAESLVGLFANTLVLRVNLTGADSFRMVVDRVRKAALEAYSHPAPLAQVIEAARPKRRSTFTPLIQSMFSNPPGAIGTRFADLDAEVFEVDPGTAMFDLSALVWSESAGWRGYLEANTDLFDHATIDDLAASYGSLLGAGVARPDDSLDRLPLIGRVAERARRPVLCLAVASTSPLDPIDDVFRFWSRRLGVDVAVEYAPFNQVLQQVVDPESVLRRNPGVSVVIVRLQDWVVGNVNRTSLDDTVREFATALGAAATSGHWLVVIAPSRTSATDAAADAPASISERMLRDMVGEMPGMELVTADDLACYSEHQDVANPPQPGAELTAEEYVALGTVVIRRLAARLAPRAKVVAVDCDNTLWTGVVGEDGPLGVVIDESRLALQRRLVTLAERGVLVGLCSRNNEADVFEVFEQHPDMVLGKAHLAGWRIGWDAKSSMLHALAANLGVALDSVVFLDDDPLVCADVRSHCPAVLTLQLPEDRRAMARMLDHIWPLDAGVVTAEDRDRIHHASRERGRDRVAAEAPTFEAFLESLKLEVTCAPLEAIDMERASQLTWRVTQFNATTRRRSPAMLRQLLAAGTTGIGVRVTDRFGDYGLVGLMLYDVAATGLDVDTFLLSCRALGRGVEHQMLRWLLGAARAQGVCRVAIPCVPTARNTPTRQFLESVVGGKAEPMLEGGRVFVVGLERMETLQPGRQPAPVETAPRDASPSGTGPGAVCGIAPIVLARIATELTTTGEIRAAMAACGAWRSRPHEAMPFEAPLTPLEGRIAGLWADALHVETVGRHDNFFDLGGHSLLVVQMVDRVQRELGVELPLRTFFATPTVAAIATAIEGGNDGVGPTTSLDLSADATLDPGVVPIGQVLHRDVIAPRVVFLTGATGFVGAHLLRALLDRTSAEVRCLVRATDTDDGRDRLLQPLRALGCTDRHVDRLTAVPGDLARPWFGLSEREFDRLAADVDAVFHCGAVVNFALPYARLKAPNVRGTEDVLRLAARGRPKVVHAVSTIGVLSGVGGPWSEGLAPSRYDGLAMGYFQSKWVAERLALEARRRGLPVNIYRLGVVGADSVTGRLGESDLVGPLLQLMATVGMVPDIDVAIDVTPVDFVAAALVAIGTRPDAVGQTFHVANPSPASIAELVTWMTKAGFPVKRVPLAEWQAEIARLASARDASESNLFLPWLAQALIGGRPDGGVLPGLQAGGRIDSRRAVEILSGTGVVCPPVSADMVGSFLR